MKPCACQPKSPLLKISQRVLDFLAWLLPSALLALVPKCPLCFAAYLAMATGLGLSFSTATIVRHSLITLSIFTLLILAIRLAWKSFGHRPWAKTVAD